MNEKRLFAIAPDAIALTMRWEHPDGWCLTVTSSTAGRDGRRSQTERYDRLTTDELVDVVSSSVQEALKGS